MNVSTKEIAEANDEMRRELASNDQGLVVISAALNAHPRKFEVIQACRNFNAFTEDNDPHGERDSAIFTIRNSKEQFMFKIDYYESNSLEFGADPHESNVFRVLTIMLTSDY